MPQKPYMVRLVGVSHYQDAIRSCAIGSEIKLLHEADNEFDDQAIAAVTLRGETAGYVPTDSWLRRAVHRDGFGASARVDQIGKGDGDNFGLRLEVTLEDGPIGQRENAG